MCWKQCFWQMYLVPVHALRWEENIEGTQSTDQMCEEEPRLGRKAVRKYRGESKRLFF